MARKSKVKICEFVQKNISKMAAEKKHRINFWLITEALKNHEIIMIQENYWEVFKLYEKDSWKKVSWLFIKKDEELLKCIS